MLLSTRPKNKPPRTNFRVCAGLPSKRFVHPLEWLGLHANKYKVRMSTSSSKKRCSEALVAIGVIRLVPNAWKTCFPSRPNDGDRHNPRSTICHVRLVPDFRPHCGLKTGPTTGARSKTPPPFFWARHDTNLKVCACANATLRKYFNQICCLVSNLGSQGRRGNNLLET